MDIEKENKKWFYTFSVDKEISKKVSEERKEPDGTTITISKEVKEKKPFIFKLRRPNRRIIEEADIYYSAKMGEYLKAGLLSRTLISKRLENDGGDLGEASKKEYAATLDSYYKISLEISSLNEELKKSETEELRAKIQSKTEEFNSIKKELFDFEINRSAIFDHSAESKALIKQIFWFVINCLYWSKDSEKDEFENYFIGRNFDERQEDYDKKEEGEEDQEFFSSINNLASFAMSYWVNSGGKASQEDIDGARKSSFE